MQPRRPSRSKEERAPRPRRLFGGKKAKNGSAGRWFPASPHSSVKTAGKCPKNEDARPEKGRARQQNLPKTCRKGRKKNRYFWWFEPKKNGGVERASRWRWWFFAQGGCNFTNLAPILLGFSPLDSPRKKKSKNTKKGPKCLKMSSQRQAPLAAALGRIPSVGF